MAIVAQPLLKTHLATTTGKAFIFVMLTRAATLATLALSSSSVLATNDENLSASSTITLKSLNIQEGSVTVSGLSSGAFMAVQMHVAFSSLFDGVGVFAGGPYYCALGSLTIAEEECMYGLMGGPKTSNLIQYTKDQAVKGAIDATSNMANDKVFLFSGSKDTVVYPSVVKTLEEYYGAFLTSNTQIATKYNLAAQHCIPSLDYGETCSVKSSPYIGHCDYEGAGTALQTFYGSGLKKGELFAPRFSFLCSLLSIPPSP